MVDLTSGLAKLPPEERLKRLRELEGDKRKELGEDLVKQRKSLEEELAKKKKELEALEQKAKKELEDAEDLEEKTLTEITRERAREVAELEARVRTFRDGNDFVPMGDEEGGDARRRREHAPAVRYAQQSAQPPGAQPGFGQTGDALYQGAFAQAQHSIDYLLHANRPSNEGRLEAERELYRSVRSLAEGAQHGGAGDEGYAFNKLQREMEHLKERGADSHGYLARIENVLNSVIDYRAEDERRRKQNPRAPHNDGGLY